MADFTPTKYLEAPTIAAVLPNEKFTLAFYVESSYSFTTHVKTVQLKILDLFSHESTIYVEDASSIISPVWLNDETIVWLSPKASGNTDIVIAAISSSEERYIAGTIPGSASDLKIKSLNDGNVAVAFAAKANADGSMHNSSDVTKPLTTAKYYTSNYVRHWNSWITSPTNAIFYGMLEAGDSKGLTLSKISNACSSELECPTPPFGGQDNFDIGQHGLVLIAKDPQLDQSLHTKQDCYFVAIADFKRPINKVVRLPLKDLSGAALAPTISASGADVALLKMAIDGREADSNRIFLVKDFASNPQTIELSTTGWGLSPCDIQFYDENNLILLAHEKGRLCSYVMPIRIDGEGTVPKQIPHTGSVLAVKKSAGHAFLVCEGSFCQPAYVETFDHADSEPSKPIHLTRQFLSPAQVSEIWWEGAAGRTIHGFVMKPSDFDSSKTYPVSFLIHGGPQDCFKDSWQPYYSLIPQIFAQAGYIVIMPQPTGSQGYGQKFVDDISRDWAGAPYEDIRTCFEHVRKAIPAADTSRAILGGLSFGGYMTNWIQGQPFGREFKAFFTLNGVFSTDMLLATEELFFARAEFGGLPWESTEARAIWQTCDPSAHTGNWSTPHLIVHSEKDYRLGIEHAIAAFNVLQARGVPSAFLNFEDEGHVLENPENIRALYQVLFKFVNPFVGLVTPEIASGEEIIYPVRSRQRSLAIKF